MRERYGARLYLFGSRARGTARLGSDYDVVAVAKAFAEQPLLRRALDRGELWRKAGGWRIALDLHCYTPEEFREELAGPGYLGQAKARGELVEVKVRRAATLPGDRRGIDGGHARAVD
ncbi:MAG: nucleotidyltransferase domain-containing protein [Chloroflexi bacterium]|nr:nucleotidyltransferase domain-containing protein [Chloroflexota bacterium]